MDYNRFLKHHCNLDVDRDVVDVNTPPGTMYKFRLWCRRWTMCSETDQLSRLYLKSNHMIRLDRKRQYKLYFWTVHPLSGAKSWWEIFYVVIFVLSIMIYPMTIYSKSSLYINMNFVLDMLFLADIFGNFFVGYIDENTKTIILDTRKIRKTYLLTFFIADLLAALPIHFILNLCNYYITSVLLLRSVRLVRIITVIKLFRVQKVRHGYSEHFIKILQMALLYFLITWVTATIILWITFSSYSTENLQLYRKTSYIFLKCLMKACYAVFLVTVDKTHDRVFLFPPLLRVVIYCVGYAFRLLVITLFLEIICSTKSTETRFKVLMTELEEYCQVRKLSAYMKKRIQTYYKCRYRGKYFNEAIINYALTTRLKKEIQVASTKRYITSIDIFAKVPEEILVELCLASKTEYYLPHDVLISENMPCDSLYILSLGTVALYDENGIEVCHLEDNCYFGEMVLMYNVERNMPTTIAISYCELLVLTKKSFESIMNDHKDILDNMYKRCNEKLHKTMLVMQHQGYQFIPPYVVVEECLRFKR